MATAADIVVAEVEEIVEELAKVFSEIVVFDDDDELEVTAEVF